VLISSRFDGLRVPISLRLFCEVPKYSCFDGISGPATATTGEREHACVFPEGSTYTKTKRETIVKVSGRGNKESLRKGPVLRKYERVNTYWGVGRGNCEILPEGIILRVRERVNPY